MKFLFLTRGAVGMSAIFLLGAASPEIAEKARLRLYAGGMDEQPLQVQSNVFNPKAEKIEETEDAGSADRGVTTTIEENREE